MIALYIFLFIGSCVLLAWAGSRLIKGLANVAKFLAVREFIVAFFIVAFAATIPNFFVGINAALRGIPHLSFGDIVGGNLVNLTLAVALAVLLGGSILPARSRMVQTSALFTAAVAILPLILVADSVLGRIDGLILFSVFVFYIVWLFSKEERFKKVYGASRLDKPKGIKFLFKNLGKVLGSLFLLLLASEGVVRSAVAFSGFLNLSLSFVGILIVGVGNALPETYFGIISARKKQNWMILGDLMGSVVMNATLVLGIVALINPIRIVDFSPFVIARIFLVVSAIFFYFFVRSEHKITKIEALFLLLLYFLFLVLEISKI